MKNLLLSFFAILTLFILSCDQKTQDAESTDQKSFDWEGTYISEAEILVLNKDFSYLLKTEIDGQKNSNTGKFNFDKSGLIIQLDQREDYFQMQENQLQKIVDHKSEDGPKMIFKKLTLRAQPWFLVEARDVSLTEMERPAMIELSEGEFTGFGGCNRLRGEVKITEESGEILFSSLGSSKMFCPDSGIEQRLMQYLNQTRNYQMLDGQLIFKDESGTTVLIFEPAVKAQTVITEALNP